jgi:hypothetical protein
MEPDGLTLVQVDVHHFILQVVTGRLPWKLAAGHRRETWEKLIMVGFTPGVN